jgi:hypothetical protein
MELGSHRPEPRVRVRDKVTNHVEDHYLWQANA